MTIHCDGDMMVNPYRWHCGILPSRGSDWPVFTDQITFIVKTISVLILQCLVICDTDPLLLIIIDVTWSHCGVIPDSYRYDVGVLRRYANEALFGAALRRLRRLSQKLNRWNFAVFWLWYYGHFIIHYSIYWRADTSLMTSSDLLQKPRCVVWLCLIPFSIISTHCYCSVLLCLYKCPLKLPFHHSVFLLRLSVTTYIDLSILCTATDSYCWRSPGLVSLFSSLL